MDRQQTDRQIDRQTFVEVFGRNSHYYSANVGVFWNASRVNSLAEERCVVIRVRHTNLNLRLTLSHTPHQYYQQ